MPRLLLVTVLLALPWSVPTVVYEVLQKSAEQIGPRNSLLELSARAEREVAWRPRTGIGILDHAEHELIESRLFWQLTTRHARERLAHRAQRDADPRSALVLAIEFARR